MENTRYATRTPVIHLDFAWYRPRNGLDSRLLGIFQVSQPLVAVIVISAYSLGIGHGDRGNPQQLRSDLGD